MDPRGIITATLRENVGDRLSSSGKAAHIITALLDGGFEIHPKDPKVAPQPAGTHVLVYGNPFDGMKVVGPITPNDDGLETYTDTELRNEDWWYAPLDAPPWTKET